MSALVEALLAAKELIELHTSDIEENCCILDENDKPLIYTMDVEAVEDYQKHLKVLELIKSALKSSGVN